MSRTPLKELLEIADENLKKSILLQIQALEQPKIVETPNYIIYSIGVESTDPHLNGALCLNDAFAEEMLCEAQRFFGDLELDYTIWVRDHADFNLERLLKNQNMTPNRTPGSAVMSIENSLKLTELPTNFYFKEVKTREDIDAFSEVVRKAFNKTPEVIEKMFETNQTLVHDAIRGYVVFADSKPVSAAMTVLSNHAAGIYWVATLRNNRGQGLGSYVTRLSTNAGFNNGKNRVILQASELGEGVYKKLGYKTISRYRTYTIKK